jgi:hypothetical protein
VPDGAYDQDVQAVTKSLKESVGFSKPVFALAATCKNGRSWGVKEVGRF